MISGPHGAFLTLYIFAYRSGCKIILGSWHAFCEDLHAAFDFNFAREWGPRKRPSRSFGDAGLQKTNRGNAEPNHVIHESGSTAQGVDYMHNGSSKPNHSLPNQSLQNQSLQNQHVIDYGCGSGILGIAALLLGAKHATGTDIDPQALLATRENVKRNQLEPRSFPVFFPEKCPQQPVAFVLANILAGPLVALAPTLIGLLKPGGKLCLSGVLDAQRDDIVAAYEDAIIIDSIDQKEEWICLTGTARS